MKIIRFQDRSGDLRVGLLQGAAIHEIDAHEMADLLQTPLHELQALLTRAAVRQPAYALADVTLLAPVDGHTEVWGAGVAYLKSRSAREEESDFQSVYTKVYDAERPELFFKAPAWRVLRDGEAGGLRSDSTDSVPEPELAIVVNRYAEIIGALVCNDLTSRSIEAENPIYLPQAKSYTGSCMLSTAIVPWWEIDDPCDLPISLTVERDAVTVYEGHSNTSEMKRSFEEQIRWLFRAMDFPEGVILSTGTGIVPPLGQTLMVGDRVTVTIDGVGTLSNVMADERQLVDGRVA